MAENRSCSVIAQPTEVPCLKVKEGQNLWQKREQLLIEYRSCMIAFWKNIVERDVSVTTECEDGSDEEGSGNILDRISSLDKRLKLLKTSVDQWFKSEEIATVRQKTCPLFATSWLADPRKFQQEPLNFDNVQGEVILNPGSDPVSFKEASEHYYDTYFENITTLCIPNLEVFKQLSRRPTPASAEKSVCREGKARNGVQSQRKPVVPTDNSQRTEPSLTDRRLMNLAISDRYHLHDPGGGRANDLESFDAGEEGANMRAIERTKAQRDIHHIPDEELEDQLGKNVKAVRQGVEGTYAVASALEKWGVERGEKMLILTEFKFKQRGSGYNGDFDVFAINQRYGFITFQVKSVKAASDKEKTQSKRRKIAEAWEQALKDVTFLHESNRDLLMVLEAPVNSSVAVPNLTSNDLEKTRLCEYHTRLVLCGTDLTDASSFDHWMERRMDCGTGPAFTEENFREVCSRYMGMVAKVEFPNRAVVIEKTRELLSTVECSDSLHAILTLDQINTVHDATLLKIITGEFGTGKSLVLVIKAKELATESNFVYLITFAGVGTDVNCYHKTRCFSIEQLQVMLGSQTRANLRLCQLSDIIKEYDACHGNWTEDWTTVSPELLNSLLEWLTAKHPGRTVHILCDEVPCYTFQSCWKVLTEFPRRHPVSCMWFVLATHSYKPTQFALDEAQWYKRLIDDGYRRASLVSSMRIPRDVYRMVQIVRGIESRDVAAGQRCGHVVPGPKPLVFILPKCICEAISSAPLSCECILERMQRALRRIFDVLDPEGAISNHDYSILVGCFVGTKFLRDLCQLLSRAFQGIGKELKFNLTAAMQSKLPTPSGQNSISVYDRYTYIGCENTIIIDIDPYALHQCGANNQWTYATMPFTRTVSQYVLFTWPKEEAKRMWDSDLDAHDALTDKRVGMKQLTEELRDIRYEMTARARLSRGDCLDKLISSNAVIVHPIDPLNQSTGN